MTNSTHSPTSTSTNWKKRAEAWNLLLPPSDTLNSCNFLNPNTSIQECIQSTLGIKFDDDNTGQHPFVEYMKRFRDSFKALQGEMRGIEQEQKPEMLNNDNQEIASIENPSDEDSSQKRKVQKISSRERELERKLLESERKSLEEKQLRLMVEVQQEIGEIRRVHDLVQVMLNWCATWGNETLSITKSDSRLTSNKEMSSVDDNDLYATPPKNACQPSIRYVKEDEFLKDLIARSSWGDLEEKYKKSLDNLATSLSDLIDLGEKSATDAHKATNSEGSEERKRQVGHIVTTILGSDFVSNDNANQSFERLQIRGSDQTTVAQPVLHAIIYRVLDIVGLRELYVSKENNTRGGSGNEKDRHVGFLVHEVQEHLSYSLPSIIESLFEVKKCEMVGKKDVKLIELAVKQAIGNSARRMRGEFNFLGIGADCELYGIATSLSKISIVKASLQKVGTKSVEISWSRTKGTDLLSSVGLQLLALAISVSYDLSRVQHSIATLKPKHISKQIDDGSRTVAEMPDFSICEYLGSGAFGIVYKLSATIGDTVKSPQQQSDFFLKIPSCQRASVSLHDEANILERLNSDKPITGKVSNIPSFKLLGSFDINLNDFTGETDGLLLNGIIGTPAHKVKYNKGQLWSVVRKVYATLTAAHERSVYHLDIQPANIIVREVSSSSSSSSSSDNDLDVLVIDWGVAISDDKQILFRGCIPYAHDELLAKARNKSMAKPEYDFASLMYTCYHLDVGFLPWNVVMDEHGKQVCDVGQRRETVLQWWEQKLQEECHHCDEDKFVLNSLQNSISIG
ncbi:unnamed protein product [Cylindrotheca closterium]|uniref:Protein kinase domain-containing protein n=1 Tax=Cylindrotheca closterium TaxID=2856 RepID=A0AAD2GBM2_9STRA|nr:unnamed protein product [Cylindrotheca closterium]